MPRNKKSKLLIAEIEALLPSLKALADRAQMIDDIHHRMKLLESMSHNLDQLANTASLLSTADAVLTRFVNDNHRISDDVRIDVETISALALKIQKDLQDLSRRLGEFEGRLSR